MSDADLFRQYAKEAMLGFSEVKDENERQNLIHLASLGHGLVDE